MRRSNPTFPVSIDFFWIPIIFRCRDDVNIMTGLKPSMRSLDELMVSRHWASGVSDSKSYWWSAGYHSPKSGMEFMKLRLCRSRGLAASKVVLQIEDHLYHLLPVLMTDWTMGERITVTFNSEYSSWRLCIETALSIIFCVLATPWHFEHSAGSKTYGSRLR